MLVNICINLHILFGLLLDAQSKFSKHVNVFVAHCRAITHVQELQLLASHNRSIMLQIHSVPMTAHVTSREVVIMAHPLTHLRHLNLTPNVLAHPQTFQNSLQPTWVIGPLSVLFQGL